MESSARAIDFLNEPRHEMGEKKAVAIQHGDIKPQNIMLVSGGIQVCDFGLAKPLNQTAMQMTAGMAATLAYAPPELLGRRGPTRWTDQYSLAVSYYELRTGLLPFPEDATVQDVVRAHTQGTLNFDGIPEEEIKVIRRATSVDAEARFETAGEMVQRLRRVTRAASRREKTAAAEKQQEPPRAELPKLAMGQNIGLGYVLDDCLARPGVDEIWKARAPGAGRSHAVILSDVQGHRGGIDFNALKCCAQISHPHLTELQAFWLLDRQGAPILDGFQKRFDAGDAGRLAIAGKLAKRNLLQALDDHAGAKPPGLPPGELGGYMRQLAEVLDFLNLETHVVNGKRFSVQHQNVRPINVVFDDNNRLRLGNFRYARLLEKDNARVENDDWIPNHIFVAPEVFRGELTRWSDQYSLALLYLHLRMGLLPFNAANSTTDLVRKVQDGKIDRITSLPTHEEQQVVRRATELNPAKRFPSCAEFVEALVKVLGPPDSPRGGEMFETKLPDTENFPPGDRISETIDIDPLLDLPPRPSLPAQAPVPSGVLAENPTGAKYSAVAPTSSPTPSSPTP
ncbi:MAG: protein kinase, partial [Planctomycetales bacterium]